MTDDPSTAGTLTPSRLGQIAFVTTVPVFAYLGHVLFDDLLFGGLVGLLVGAGELLYFPYVLRKGAAGDGGGAHVDRGDVRRAAVGLPLSSAGMVALAGRFVVDGYLVPFAAAGVFAAVAFVPLDLFLPGPGGDDSTG